MTPLSAAALFGTMVALSLAPGPTEVALVARSTTRGLPSGVAMIAGIVLADVVLVAVAFSGLAAAAAALGSVPTVVVGLSGVFLVLIGTAQLRTPASASEGSSSEARLSSFAAGLLLTLGDPKAVLGYAALLPAFVDLSSASIVDAFYVFLLAATAIVLVKGLYIVLADRAASVLFSARSRRTLNRVAGGVLVSLGTVLVVRALLQR